MLQGSYVIAGDLLGVLITPDCGKGLCILKCMDGKDRKVNAKSVTCVANPFAYAALLQVKAEKKIRG